MMNLIQLNLMPNLLLNTYGFTSTTRKFYRITRKFDKHHKEVSPSSTGSRLEILIA